MKSKEDSQAFYESYFERNELQFLSYLWNFGAYTTKELMLDYLNQPKANLLEIGKLKKANLLEIGPGLGSMLYLAKERFGESFEFHINDLSKKTLEFVKEKFPSTQCHHGDLRELLLPPKSFDIILASHVLEHIEQDLDYLEACYDLMKDGGQLIMLMPGRKSGKASEEEFRNMGHFRLYNFERMALIEEHFKHRLEFNSVFAVHAIIGRWAPILMFLQRVLNLPFKFFDGKCYFERPWLHGFYPILHRFFNSLEKAGYKKEPSCDYNILFCAIKKAI